MKNTLIADAGSTKTQWVLIDCDGKISMCDTKGFNPNYNNVSELIDELQTKLDGNFKLDVGKVFYYGTGCGNEHNCSIVRGVLQMVWGNAEINVTHDLMAAAHAVLGKQKGVACILGTGSNACLYDGEKIISQAVSLGYILGDEGGGACIGKSLLHDYFYGIMPHELREKFTEQYQITRDVVIDSVYKKESPSAFLASFAKFAEQNVENEYVYGLCHDSFSKFIDYHVLALGGNVGNVGFVGSVAYYFKDVLLACAKDKNLTVCDIIRQPVSGLVKYHTENI